MVKLPDPGEFIFMYSRPTESEGLDVDIVMTHHSEITYHDLTDMFKQFVMACGFQPHEDTLGWFDQ